jgi:hypothetical protein
LIVGVPLQIKNFSDGKDGEAAKDQAGAAAAAAELGKAGAPAPQVIPHALAKLEKPEDEMYTVSSRGWRELGAGLQGTPPNMQFPTQPWKTLLL